MGRAVRVGWLSAVSFLALLSLVSATHPYNWNPSVSLVDDSDEPDGNGFCPDIVGFGSGLNCDRLHAHSCKPQGSDTQFMYHVETSTIRSVNYDGNCASINNNDNGRIVLNFFDNSL